MPSWFIPVSRAVAPPRSALSLPLSRSPPPHAPALKDVAATSSSPFATQVAESVQAHHKVKNPPTPAAAVWVLLSSSPTLLRRAATATAQLSHPLCCSTLQVLYTPYCSIDLLHVALCWGSVFFKASKFFLLRRRILCSDDFSTQVRILNLGQRS
jgi:hypothetical protein